MSGAAKLRQLLNQPGPIVAPGVYDCLSAKAAERAGFKAVFISGAALTASLLGYPDVGLQTMPEVLNQSRNIARSVDIPVTADADTGFGNALNLMRAVREFEAAGLAGMMFEDQTFPKKCGHFEGKSVIPAEEMVIKIQAAVEARTNKDFVLTARTDARATHGLEEAIRRGVMYAEAGADMIFADALLSVEDLKAFAAAVPVHVKANMQEGDGKTPMLHYDELYAMGFKMIEYSGTLQRTALKAMFDALEMLKSEGTTSALFPDRILSLPQRSELLGLAQFYELEERFYGAFAETEGSWRNNLDASANAAASSRAVPI